MGEGRVVGGERGEWRVVVGEGCRSKRGVGSRSSSVWCSGHPSDGLFSALESLAQVFS